jgi:hypothetical protein
LLLIVNVMQGLSGACSVGRHGGVRRIRADSGGAPVGEAIETATPTRAALTDSPEPPTTKLKPEPVFRALVSTGALNTGLPCLCR